MMIQNIPKEKILEALQEGPTLPMKIVRKVGGDTMLIGAILSTLISTGDVAVSSLKIGGSPLYYIPGQEEKLEGYIDHLNEKDQRTFKLLKEKKVLHDPAQEPLVRVSLKIIRDFAKPFSFDKESFYRFYTVEKAEAEELAKAILHDLKRTSQEIITDPGSSSLDKTIEVQRAISEAPEQIVVREKIIHTKKIDKLDTKDALDAKETVAAKKENSVEAKKDSLESKKYVVEGKRDSVEPKESAQAKKDFFDQVKAHVHDLNLDIISKEKIKKTEYVLILKNHDTNEYIYCCAKDKKNINEGDLSTAFVFSHNKKMPCLFLITGSLTKKAEAMTHKEFKDMKIEKM